LVRDLVPNFSAQSLHQLVLTGFGSSQAEALFSFFQGFADDFRLGLSGEMRDFGG
jgi:hypothetical protein